MINIKRYLFILICIFIIDGFTVLSAVEKSFLAGNENGLYEVNQFSGNIIWNDAAVFKICKAGNQWLFLTSKGIAGSKNLKNFYYLNDNLPQKIIKVINSAGEKEFIKKNQQLKDLEVHPLNPNIFVTATSNSVFLTTDAGKTWMDLGCNGAVNGIKAVLVVDMPDESGKDCLTVFVSHALYGVAWKQPFINKQKWNELNDGLAIGPESVEEISDIVFAANMNKYEVYCSQTFSGNIYKLNWSEKTFIHFEKNQNASCIESLNINNNVIVGVMPGSLFKMNIMLPAIDSYADRFILKNFDKIKRFLETSNFLCAFISKKYLPFTNDIALSELWLLHNSEVQKQKNKYLEIADKKKGLYIPTHQVKNTAVFEEHLSSIKKNKLNAIVVDMKDEAGFVRYNTENPDIRKFGGVRYELNLEEFIQKAKADNLYLIARLVAFKDKNLYRYDNNRYAVKDKNTKKAWQGYNTRNGEKEMIEEYWVDPYNEDVWKYNIDIAEELCERGFDEIQFDYIRFPTDGANLGQTYYPACENGMDKVSALMSFLAYARARIKAPISIDIYGANGWYRTGARTGQEVELLSEYVDVICPMFYPSHFSQSFLAYSPAEERPYRIYKQGSFRNKIISRNKTIIRPWAQAFFIPVSYDKKYYDVNYVKRQILGIKDSIDEGYIYWNNSGRYKDILPDGEPL